MSESNSIIYKIKYPVLTVKEINRLHKNILYLIPSKSAYFLILF